MIDNPSEGFSGIDEAAEGAVMVTDVAVGDLSDQHEGEDRWRAAIRQKVEGSVGDDVTKGKATRCVVYRSGL